MANKKFQIWMIWVLFSLILVSSGILFLLCIIKPIKPKKVDVPLVVIKEAEKQIVEENIADAQDLIATENVDDAVVESSDDDIVISAPVSSSKFDIPLASNNATLVFIFDDAGQSLVKLQKYSSLPFPLTVAVLPGLVHSVDCAKDLRKNNKEVMLHQPMQALNRNINPGPGAITPDMDNTTISNIVKKNIASIAPIKGVNNHEGSLVTSDLVKMITVLDVVHSEGLYFVDSRTTADTKIPQAGLMVGINVYSNDVFLDNVVERGAILEQIYKGISLANKNGRVVMIGHIDKSSAIIPKLLSEMYPLLVEKGYKFATLSQYK